MLATDVADVDHLGLERLAAAEREQLADQLGRAGRGLRDHLRVVPGLGSGDRLLEHPGVIEDDEQQVVEVVRDAAGELADQREPILVHGLGLLRAPPR